MLHLTEVTSGNHRAGRFGKINKIITIGINSKTTWTLKTLPLKTTLQIKSQSAAHIYQSTPHSLKALASTEQCRTVLNYIIE
jgi:hypothetical protein